MSSEPVAGIYAGSTAGKSTLCKTYPEEFYDPEDIPEKDRPARLTEIRDLKPWREDNVDSRALNKEMNQIYAALYKMHGRNRAIVSHFVMDPEFCKSASCTPVLAISRKPTSVVELQARRGDDSPSLAGMVIGYQRAQAWTKSRKVPSITLNNNQFLTSPDILDRIRGSIEDFYG